MWNFKSSYLHHQGRSFTQRFDANTYLLMTRALTILIRRDTNDDLVAALEHSQARFLVSGHSPAIGVFLLSAQKRSSTR